MPTTEKDFHKSARAYAAVPEITTLSDLKHSLGLISTADYPIEKNLDSFAPISIFDRNNRGFALLAGLSAPLLGSALSVMVIISIIWALISLVMGRFEFKISKNEKMVALAFATFATVHILISVGHSGFRGFDQWITPIVFFGPLILASRFNLSGRAILFDLFVIGSAIGTILAGFFATYEFAFLSTRAEGLLGNSGIFALIGCASGGIGGLNLHAQSKNRMALGAACLLAMIIIVILSQMRAMFPAAAIIVFIVIFTAKFSLSRKQKARLVIFAALASAIFALAIVNSTISNRFKLIEQDITQIFDQSDYNSSIGQRVAMWQGAYFAIQNHPVLGYGMADRMTSIEAYLKDNFANLPRSYSHPHNAGLTALLDAGIPGLLSLIFMTFSAVFVAIKQPRSPQIISYFLIITISYCFSGLTGIMFHHDIADTFFVVATAFGMHQFSDSA